ncbi:MAG: hypothetical protein KC613_04315 [Myxococcales bacterium]|nr:hypothetical protein [Myxococcales bacterium]MCB9522990.1 hypothetical protein [Myxococcales bacterium]
MSHHAALRRLALGLGLAMAACTAEPTSLTILQMQPLDSDCVPVQDSQLAVARGVVDIALATSYVAFPLARNNMVDIVNARSFQARDGRIKSHDVLLREAVVDYTTLDPITATLPQRRVIPLSGTIQINTQVALGVELLDPGMVQAIRQSPEFLVIDSQDQARPIRTQVTMVAKITLRGNLPDGSEIESNELRFPIQICNGCRVTYPPEAIDDAAGRTPNCLALNLADETREAPVCPAFIGTDDRFVDCRDCQGFAVDSLARQLCQPPAGL